MHSIFWLESRRVVLYLSSFCFDSLNQLLQLRPIDSKRLIVVTNLPFQPSRPISFKYLRSSNEMGEGVG
jgi:hypothetical protein